MAGLNLNADREEIPEPVFRWKQRRGLLLLLVLVLILTARSLGFLTLEWYRANLVGKNVSESQLELAGVNTTTETHVSTEYNSKPKVSEWKAGLNLRFQDLARSGDLFKNDDKGVLEKAIKEKFSKEQINFSNIKVGSIEYSGSYWFPLAKKGRALFKIWIDENIPSGHYAVSFDGAFDFEVYGLCSISKLAENVNENIAVSVVAKIKEDLKKK